MKQLLAILMLMVLISSCKTTEANYRAAYEVARQKKADDVGVDLDTRARINAESIESRLIVGADTIPIMAQTIKIADSSIAPDSLKRLSLVVVGFKQIFNARAMMNRLRSQGYPEAFIIYNSEPYYYVAIGTVSQAADAAQLYKQVKADPAVVTRVPFPWLLQSTHLPPI